MPPFLGSKWQGLALNEHSNVRTGYYLERKSGPQQASQC
jgi:hypothetical protein